MLQLLNTEADKHNSYKLILQPRYHIGATWYVQH